MITHYHHYRTREREWGGPDNTRFPDSNPTTAINRYRTLSTHALLTISNVRNISIHVEEFLPTLTTLAKTAYSHERTNHEPTKPTQSHETKTAPVNDLPTWALILAVALALAVLIVVGVYLLSRQLQHKEPYAGVMRLRTRQKINFFRFMATDSRVPKKVKFVPILLALYLLMPFDLIPDFIPVIGYIDDVGVIILALVLMVKLTPAETITAILEKASDH